MDFLNAYLSEIEQAIGIQKFSNEPQNLYEPINYILNLGGKRLRPVMLLMANDLFKGNKEQAIPLALAIEFFHNFTLMHDDVMDNAPLRRGKPTVHTRYNLNAAILSGDALLVKAYQYFEHLPPTLFKRCVQIFSQTAITLCEGQQMDIDFEEAKSVSYDDYIRMISYKTGVLGGAAFQIGALVAGATEEQAELLYDFGLNLGIAFQIKDDYLDVFGDDEKFGKKKAGDIIENKKTILYVLAMQHADEETRKELTFWYSIKSENVDKVYAVEKIFRKIKVNELTLDAIQKYNQEGLKKLDALNVDDEMKKPFRELAEYLLVREM